MTSERTPRGAGRRGRGTVGSDENYDSECLGWCCGGNFRGGAVLELRFRDPEHWVHRRHAGTQVGGLAGATGRVEDGRVEGATEGARRGCRWSEWR